MGPENVGETVIACLSGILVIFVVGGQFLNEQGNQRRCNGYRVVEISKLEQNAFITLLLISLAYQ